MLSRPLGAILAVLVGVAAAPAQFAPPPDLPPSAGFPSDATGVPADGGIPADRFGLGGTPDPYRWWLGGEYLYAFTRDTTVPAVVSVGTPASGGVVGLAGTQLLASNTPKYDGVSGYRIGGGVWLDSCRAYGVEWSVFFLPQQQASNTFQASPGQVLARPFFDTTFGVENSRRISAPGLFSGSAATHFSTRFWGGEFGARLRVIETPTLSLEQLFHFRFYELEETFTASDNSTALPGGVVAFSGQAFGPPAQVQVNDTYAVRNRFYGGSAGLRLLWTPGRWEVRLDGRMGVGAMEQTATLSGTTTLLNAGSTTTVPAGFYTSGTTTGATRRYEVSLAPDVQGRVGYRLTDWLMVHAGYQFLYMTNVARPGDMVDRRLNAARIPSSQTFGAAAPPVQQVPTYDSRDFWMHGLTAGVMITF